MGINAINQPTFIYGRALKIKIKEEEIFKVRKSERIYEQTQTWIALLEQYALGHGTP